MTTAKFTLENGLITGFSLKGHATTSAADENGRLVCAAVSSAAYMAANTLSEIIGAKIEADVSDGEMRVQVQEKLAECQPVLQGFKLHLSELEKDYKGNIKICF